MVSPRKALLSVALFATLCIWAEAVELPVLRVMFDGKFTRDMDYTNGTMQLTDTDGSVVTLPAKFRIRGATARRYLMKPSFNMKLRTADYAEEADSSLLGMRSCSSWILDVSDLSREVELVARWYEARFCEMDAYFGTTDSITDRIAQPSAIPHSTAFDLLGRPVSHPMPSVIIRSGRKYLTR